MKHDSEGSVELSLAAWPHWPGNCCVDQVNFCLRDPRASDSQVLKLVRVTHQHTLSPSSSLSSSSFSGSSFFLLFFFNLQSYNNSEILFTIQKQNYSSISFVGHLGWTLGDSS